ncbi:MAG: hypothetical protein R6X19_08445 [Kiritimatiellia bacterium]
MSLGRKAIGLLGQGFATIAFWQFMGFLLLIGLIWLNELINLTALIWGEDLKMQPNMFRGALLTAAVMLVAIIIVGHTYEQQKRVIGGMMTVCAYCKRVRLKHESWEQIEEYVARKSDATFSHGICPDCFEKHANMIKQRRPGMGGPDENA